jgi:hypothetical protein
VRTIARITVFAAVFVTGGQVLCCVCGAVTPSDGFDRAQAVFTGTVIKASKSTWTVSVQRVWKGDVESVVTLRDAHAGTSCASSFRRGATYLFLVNVESVNGAVRYSPQVCNWTNRLKSDKVRFGEDGPSRWVEDWVLTGRGAGHAPQTHSP